MTLLKDVPVCYLLREMSFNQDVRSITPIDGLLHGHFLAYLLLQSSAYQKQVAADLGATINSINGSQLLKYRFTVPKPAEQQRIAACLSSLDDQLAEQSRKVAGLARTRRA